jgi:ankyrin repeat protein/L-ascorbate metabolism protein UlaG (beta-lactamase superfamily)
MKNFAAITILSFILIWFSTTTYAQTGQMSDELHKAIGNNNIEKVVQMIEGEIGLLNAPNPRGSTPICVAASKGYTDIVKYLIKKGADVNKGNFFGSTPLHYAAWASDLESFRLLLKNGAVINAENNDGQTPLQFACLGANIEIMKVCISEGTDIKAIGNDGSGLIHWAANGGNLNMFKYLESNGLKYDAKDKDNSSTLFWASSGNAIDVVKYLIEEKKMDVNEVDNLNNIPLNSAVEHGRLDIVKYLLEKGANINHALNNHSTWLILAAQNNNPELIQLLIDKGTKINEYDDFGNTALITAAGFGNFDNVKALVDNGANLNPGLCKRESCSNTGQTPLHSASWRFPYIAEYLIEKGCDVNKKDLNGNAALHHATFCDSIKMIDLLCTNKADVNSQNNLGQTPMILSIMRNKPEIVSALLSNNADLSMIDNNGKTALHYAAIEGNIEIFELLLKNKAEVNIKDKEEHTPAYYAVYYGHTKLAEQLFKLGASKENIPYKNTELLKKEINNGEAVVWYLNHSAWAVKTKNHLLVFDYWQQNDDPNTPSINNGRINPEEIVNQNVLVFASHTHQDHFSPDIFNWGKTLKNINYILGFETDDYKEYSYIQPRELKTINGVKITAIPSTDSGEGFMVEVNGLTIYHPGDHANRFQEGDNAFTDEIDFLAKQYNKIDIAFVPITGCSFRDKKALNIGNNYLVEKFNPSLVLPMHGSGNEDKYIEYANERDNPVYKFVSNKGDRLLYQKKENSL